MATVNVSSDSTDRARRGLPPRPGTKVTYTRAGRLSGDKPAPIRKSQRMEIHHASRKNSITPVARNSRSGRVARANAGIKGFDSDSTRNTPRVSNLGKFGFPALNQPTGYQHVLMAEMLVAFGVIGIRAISDYTPASDISKPGTENPTKGASPIVLIAATLMVYFVLAFMASRGGWAARAAAAFGALMIIGLMINSESELADVATWIDNLGANASNQSATSSPSTNLPNSSSSNNGNAGSNSSPSIPTIPGTVQG